MTLHRAARVARTAHDLKHLSRLKPPVWGAVKLCLSVGGSASFSHLPEGIPIRKQESKATNDFHFAPEHEKVKIKYKIDDPASSLKKARLELFRRTASVWKRDLKEAEYSDGEHEIEWEGKVDKSAEFPEEYLTIQHSPYKLKLTVEGEGGQVLPAQAWTFFHILAHSIELEKGTKDVLKESRDKELFDTLGALPTADAKTPQRVYLVSNVFSTGDGTNFVDEYKKVWGEGPNIPIFARIYVRTSGGKKADVPKAVGKLKLLWDWKDEGKENLSIHFTEGAEFLKDSINYDVNATRPSGDNCHLDRGGKRGPGAKTVYPDQPGYAPAAALSADTFPFEVKACSTRKWSAYSFTWPTGKLMGKTGVLFQPSRMGGDNFRVSAYLAHSRKPDLADVLDSEDDKVLKHALKISTGRFEVWREFHINKYYRKNAAITAVTLATVTGYYEKAYIRVVDKSGGITDGMPGYEGKMRAKANGMAWYIKLAVDPADQGTATRASLLFRSHGDWKSAIMTNKSWNAAQLNTWLTANSFETLQKYKTACEAWTDGIVPAGLGGYLPATDGLTIFQFERYWAAGGGLNSGTNGFASTDITGIKRSKAGYLQCATPATYDSTEKNNMQQTTTHEIGHCCYLQHTDDVSGGGTNLDLHDDDAHWHYCTMSYNYAQERKFCGMCMLRLRGWDTSGMTRNRAANKKP